MRLRVGVGVVVVLRPGLVALGHGLGSSALSHPAERTCGEGPRSGETRERVGPTSKVQLATILTTAAPACGQASAARHRLLQKVNHDAHLVRQIRPAGIDKPGGVSKVVAVAAWRGNTSMSSPLATASSTSQSGSKAGPSPASAAANSDPAGASVTSPAMPTASSSCRVAEQPAGPVGAQVEEQDSVRRQIGGHGQRGMGGEISGAGDHAVARVHELRGDQVTFDGRREPDREIDALRHKIDVGVGEEAIDLQFGDAARGSRQQRHDARLSEGDRGGEPQEASRRAGDLRRLVAGRAMSSMSGSTRAR